MLNALGTVAVIALIPLVVALIAAFHFLERLIRHEYTFHRDAWERDRRAFTPHAHAGETTWLGSGFAFWRCALSWALHTPEWARVDPAAIALLSRWRCCVLPWNIGCIALLLFVVVGLRRYEASNQAMQLTAVSLAINV